MSSNEPEGTPRSIAPLTTANQQEDESPPAPFVFGNGPPANSSLGFTFSAPSNPGFTFESVPNPGLASPTVDPPRPVPLFSLSGSELSEYRAEDESPPAPFVFGNGPPANSSVGFTFSAPSNPGFTFESVPNPELASPTVGPPQPVPFVVGIFTSPFQPGLVCEQAVYNNFDPDNVEAYLSGSDLSEYRATKAARRAKAKYRPPVLSGLLRLPVELRLEIYKYIPSAFTLLQLAYTHPRILNEIRSEPDIYTAKFGYCAPADETPPHLHPFQLSRVDRLLDRAEFYCTVIMDKKYHEGGGHVRKMWCMCCLRRYTSMYFISVHQAGGGFFCGVCKGMNCNRAGALLGGNHGERGGWKKENGLWVYHKDIRILISSFMVRKYLVDS